MNWVEINLPWDCNNEVPDPKQTQLYAENAEFYAWLKAQELALFPDSRLDMSLDDMQTAEAVAPELSRKDMNDPFWGTEIWLATIVAKYPNEKVLDLAHRRYASQEFNRWCNENEVVKAWNQKRIALQVDIDSRMFRRHPMCRPGVLIEIGKEGVEEREHILLGNMNDRGGYCECCSSSGDFVFRAIDLKELPEVAAVWTKKTKTT